MSGPAVAAKVGVSLPPVYKYSNGITIENVYAHKLTAADVKKMQHMRLDGIVLRVIAAKFSVSIPTVFYHTRNVNAPTRRNVWDACNRKSGAVVSGTAHTFLARALVRMAKAA
jgi:hypothetical protein